MKITIPFLLLGWAAGVLTAATPLASTGKILILDNDQLIEGEVQRDGTDYVIRRGMGKTAIPALRVVAVVADRDQAYRAMRERCNLRDFDDRLRLVRWCLQNGYRDEALRETEELHRYRPEDPQVRTLLLGLRELKKSPAVAISAPAKVQVKPVRVVEVEPLDFNRETFGQFVAKVQPILMNLCARCHVSNDEVPFQLTRVIDASDRKATLLNLSAVLRQVKRDDLDASPVLLKSITAHGKAVQPSMRDRQSPAFQNLEAWVHAAVPPIDPPTPVPVVTPVIAEQPKPIPVTTTKFGETSTSRPNPEPQAEAKDPFDPAIFNGTIQPKK
ncbi:MAG: hypothetical protein K8T89_00165 [Planctomycetes bacterium]|nr:hypothetical protein [Planctomycetota bacterium]